MKAIAPDRFGPPDTLQLVDAERPEIGPADVLLKVYPAAVNPYGYTSCAATRASHASWAASV